MPDVALVCSGLARVLSRAGGFARRASTMPHRPSRRIVLALIALAFTGSAFAEATKGTFGFVAKVDAEGIFDPVLKSVHIESVQPGLPAALAGMVAGDSILEVEGTRVAGAKASVMAQRMKKKPGESVLLKLLRVGGETYVVTLVAATAKN
jgi:C-terminal processing protease CtpA/Prc